MSYPRFMPAWNFSTFTFGNHLTLYDLRLIFIMSAKQVVVESIKPFLSRKWSYRANSPLLLVLARLVSLLSSSCDIYLVVGQGIANEYIWRRINVLTYGGMCWHLSVLPNEMVCEFAILLISNFAILSGQVGLPYGKCSSGVSLLT